MKIKVRTTGLLSEYLPPGSDRNVAELEVGDGTTPIDVLKQLGMPLDGAYLMAVNGQLVPSADRADYRLAEDDKLSIMPPLKGG
ncbi:MAG: MoaD/ThiS family protein [Gammaproteobacteria bacterium]|nr:MoaD/ThiS family protein [Gammaproteobacteria bacterium]MDH3464463.1 MoaD/ThiS family protein [Gammaproteobacteria bacterium]